MSSGFQEEFRNRRATKRIANEKKQKEAAERAQQRAEQGEPIFYEGKEAVSEVAKKEGIWNWALLGPSPEELPLVNGGGAGVEEMAQAMDQHAQSVAVIRATFGVEGEAFTKYVIIQVKSAARFTTRERGQATTGAPQVQIQIEKYIPLGSLKIEMSSKENCTVADFLAKLREAAPDDAARMTEEAYAAALKSHEQANPFINQKTEKQERVKELLEEVHAPPAAVVEPEPEAPPAEAEQLEMSRLRGKVKPFQVGDQVEVYSARNGTWMLDAEVVKVVKEACVLDGFNVPAGCMKVVYGNGKRFKWVALQQMEGHLRPSSRPKPPESKTGEMQKETHNWITQWHERYFELQKGFLQWWVTEKDAKDGVAANGSLYMLGLQLKVEGDVLKMRTDNSQGVIFTFRTNTKQETAEWSEALWSHAGFCDDIREFIQVKQDGSEMRKELMTMMATRKSRKSIASTAKPPAEE